MVQQILTDAIDDLNDDIESWFYIKLTESSYYMGEVAFLITSTTLMHTTC